MKRLMESMILMAVLVVPFAAWGDAQVHEWIGTYQMSLDGRPGTLAILDSKVDCAAPPWCGLIVKYTDGQGITFKGKIDTIDQKFQHMVFHIAFPGNNQKFDAYLFSWDKTKLAGITYWGGRTFGFFATK